MERRSDDAVWLSPLPTDVSAELIFADGKKQKVEFYYGSGFLSQSSRKIRVPKAVREIVIHDYAGKSRKLTPRRPVGSLLLNLHDAHSPMKTSSSLPDSWRDAVSMGGQVRSEGSHGSTGARPTK